MGLIPASVATSDHLRVCGADGDHVELRVNDPGSSPRVRSRQGVVPVIPEPIRIISACAEQTRTRRRGLRLARDHLRVCGADGRRELHRDHGEGSSPRVRSRQGHRWSLATRSRIISACAEQTTRVSAVTGRIWDHLRVCGADKALQQLPEVRTGSSPRVRSRLRGSCNVHAQRGIISACAEQTTA